MRRLWHQMDAWFRPRARGSGYDDDDDDPGEPMTTVHAEAVPAAGPSGGGGHARLVLLDWPGPLSRWPRLLDDRDLARLARVTPGAYAHLGGPRQLSAHYDNAGVKLRTARELGLTARVRRLVVRPRSPSPPALLRRWRHLPPLPPDLAEPRLSTLAVPLPDLFPELRVLQVEDPPHGGGDGAAAAFAPAEWALLWDLVRQPTLQTLALHLSEGAEPYAADLLGAPHNADALLAAVEDRCRGGDSDRSAGLELEVHVDSSRLQLYTQAVPAVTLFTAPATWWFSRLWTRLLAAPHPDLRVQLPTSHCLMAAPSVAAAHIVDGWADEVHLTGDTVLPFGFLLETGRWLDVLDRLHGGGGGGVRRRLSVDWSPRDDGPEPESPPWRARPLAPSSSLRVDIHVHGSLWLGIDPTRLLLLRSAVGYRRQPAAPTALFLPSPPVHLWQGVWEGFRWVGPNDATHHQPGAAQVVDHLCRMLRTLYDPLRLPQWYRATAPVCLALEVPGGLPVDQLVALVRELRVCGLEDHAGFASRPWCWVLHGGTLDPVAVRAVLEAMWRPGTTDLLRWMERRVRLVPRHRTVGEVVDDELQAFP